MISTNRTDVATSISDDRIRDATEAQLRADPQLLLSAIRYVYGKRDAARPVPHEGEYIGRSPMLPDRRLEPADRRLQMLVRIVSVGSTPEMAETDEDDLKYILSDP